MTARRDYLAQVIRLYLEPPGSPDRASRADWAIANTIYDRNVPLDTLAYAIRLPTLRRRFCDGVLEPVRTLAFYRRVLENLTPQDLDPGYQSYVDDRYQRLLDAALSDRQIAALSDRR